MDRETGENLVGAVRGIESSIDIIFHDSKFEQLIEIASETTETQKLILQALYRIANALEAMRK